MCFVRIAHPVSPFGNLFRQCAEPLLRPERDRRAQSPDFEASGEKIGGRHFLSQAFCAIIMPKEPRRRGLQYKEVIA